MHKQGALREFGHYAAMNILGMIGISCYILADTYFVAQGLGSLGLAALNIAIPAYNLMNGIGLMLGVETVRPVADVICACAEQGVLVISAKNKVRLLPALNIPMAQLEQAIGVLKAVCAEV